nr:uncharacterized protein LOC127328578 [Lolium perenne]
MGMAKPWAGPGVPTPRQLRVTTQYLSEAVKNPGLAVDPCIIGGELRRRRLTLVPGAVVWELAEEVLMEKAQADLTALKKQGDELQRQCADSAATLKSINETLKGLSTSVPHVDSTLQVLQKSVDAMGNRVTQLGRCTTGDRAVSPRQASPGAMDAGQPSGTLKVVIPHHTTGRKDFPHTPIQFDIGDRSGAFDESGYNTSRVGNYHSRPPKQISPGLMERTPSGGKLFISAATVAHLKLATQEVEPVTVQVADSRKSQITTAVREAAWECRGAKFKTTFRVFNIPCYDIILGMDWLNECGKMWIDWPNKTLRFRVQGKRVTLKGIKDNVRHRDAISASGDSKIDQTKRSCTGHSSRVQAGEAYENSPLPPEIEQLLQGHANCFDTPKDLPPHRSFDHGIELMPGVQPVNVKPYLYSPQQKDEIERQIKDMIRQGIIKPSQSPFASPVLLVRKKDGTWRFCVDYRQLNAVTVKDRYHMPIVDELLDELAGAQFFTKLDLRSGYHQIRMRDEDERKTAFKTHEGHYEFRVMPFGLTSAPATFQTAMNTIFAHAIRRFVLVFVDDVLIYSKTLADHKRHLAEVFQILEQNKLFLKKSKCSFAQKSLEYLGHIISANGVATDPAKISAVQHWPQPRDVKQVRGFLGLAGYYRKFIRHFGIICRPLTNLLKKNVPFVWSPVVDDAFQTLKRALVQAPVLALPDFQQEFVIEMDACATGIGAVLMQHGHPLTFLSRALGPKNQALSIYDKECLAILLAIEKWKSYLQHAPFVIHTDQRSLIHLGEHKFNTKIQQKAFFRLLGLQYKIIYKKGKANVAADALSRRPMALCAVSMARPRWMEIVIEGYTKDEKSKQLYT